MRVHEYVIAGDPVEIRVCQSEEDLGEFCRWVQGTGSREPVAVDTETTGLAIYTPGYRLRLVQFGTADVAYVLPVELGEAFQRAARWALLTLPRVTIHNAPFDWLVLDAHLSVPLEELFPRTLDTKVLAHLHDSRQDHEGGAGVSLKPLAAFYVDPKAPDTQGGLTKVFNSLGFTKQTGWAGIPLDNPVYELYAGLDVILTARLRPVLQELCEEMGVGPRLIAYEHRQAKIGAIVQRRGMRLDAEYTEGLIGRLAETREHYERIAARYGVTSVNSPKQVYEALQGMGEVWTETTDSGAPSTASEVLLPMADLDKDWERIGAREPNPLADAVLRAKRAGKWSKSYAVAMLEGRDANGRVHPSINTLGARTARWAVSGPPLQQLPSKGWTIRRCIVADEGHVIAASDFAQVELRVLAALADAASIVEAINNGQDLHSYTTRLVFSLGDEVTDAELKDDRRRKLCKVISLGKAYAGGPKTLARQTGLPIDQVKQAVDQYDKALPAIAKFARRLTRDAQANRMTVETPSGRLLRLDRDKAYAAIAYLCQSTARDILGQALINIEDAGLLHYVIGVVHDELIVSAPEHEAAEVIERIGELMNMRFFGIDILSDPEVYGPSWGSGYKCPAGEDFRQAA